MGLKTVAGLQRLKKIPKIERSGVLNVHSLIWISFLILLNTTIKFTECKNTAALAQCVRLLEEAVIKIVTQPESKCESHGCVKTAAQIIDFADESIDPCEDFYQFANGRYINEISAETEDDERNGITKTVSDLMNKRVGALLSEPVQPDEWKPIRLAKHFYKSCLNQPIIVKRDNQQLIDILDSLGGWPVVKGSSWSSRDFDFVEFIGKIQKIGFDTDIIFGLTAVEDPRNTTNKILQISTGNYAEITDEYRKSMFEITEIFANKNDKTAKVRIKNEMEKVATFESRLKNIPSSFDGVNNNEKHIDDDDNDNDSDNDDDDDDIVDDIVGGLWHLWQLFRVSTIKELQESYPYLNWLRYINAILPSGLNVTENEPIRNSDPLFFEGLSGVLRSTSKRTMINYVLWRAIWKTYELQNFETGKTRRKECITLTADKFSIPVGLLYSRKYFSEETRQAVIDMVEDVRHAFIVMLGEVTWMDDEVREKAIEKAEKIVVHVGYSNELYENVELEEYYEDLEMEPDDYFNNSLRWDAFNSTQEFRTLRRSVNISGWEKIRYLNPTYVNAFYFNEDNTMQFPIAILHELYFSVDRPQYINYASLGSTIGHEITHGFDSTGRQFWLNGNRINWWSPETKRTFLEKVECIVDQYNHYTDSKTSLMLNGKLTKDENIADNGGTRVAYNAYLKWIDRHGPETLIPGFKYNQKQLFWLSFAQSQSEVYGEKSLISLIETDEHAPDEFRVNGVVSNMQEFANDFNCPVGSKMNPAQKCIVW